MSSLYNPAVLQSSPQATATDLQRIFVQAIENLKASHQQMLTKITGSDQNALRPLLPTLEQDFRALGEFIGRFDSQFTSSLPARQGVQLLGGPIPTPLPDENIDPNTLAPLASPNQGEPVDPNLKVEYNDENVEFDHAKPKTAPLVAPEPGQSQVEVK